MRWLPTALATVAFGVFCSGSPALALKTLNLARAGSPAPVVVTPAKPGSPAYELAQIGGINPVPTPALATPTNLPATPNLSLTLTTALPVPVPADVPLPAADFFAQVLTAIHALGGLSLLLKVSLIITLLVSSMKVSALNDLLWKPLGAAQPWVAPFLGLLAGVMGLGAGGVPVTLPLVFAYVSAGGGAVFLHEMLDSLKKVPVLGPLHVRAIEIYKKTLGGTKRSFDEPKIITPRE